MSLSQGSQTLNWRNIHGLFSASFSSLRSVEKGSLSEYPGQLGVYISVELLDAVSQAAQKYEALYMGTLPVTKAMGED